MDWEAVFYITSLSIGIIVSLGIARYAWRRRSIPGVEYFILYTLAAVVWALGTLLASASANPAQERWWDAIAGLGVVVMPVAWLGFTLKYTGREKWLATRTWILVAIAPIVAFLLIGGYNIYRASQQARAVDIGAPNPLVAIIAIGSAFYLSALLIIATLLVIQELIRAPRVYRGQYISLLLGVSIPWFFGLLSLWGLDLFPVELLPIAFAIGGLVIAWGIFRHHVFDIMPIALDTVIESISDGVIVLDTQHRIVDLNPAAQRMTNLSTKEMAGLPITEALPAWKDLLGYMDQSQTQVQIDMKEPVLTLEGQVSDVEGGRGEGYYELRISSLYDRREALSGWLVLLHDITERVRAEEALRLTQFTVDHAADAIFWMGPDARLLHVNDAACHALGYPREELLSMTIHDVDPNFPPEAWRDHWGEIQEHCCLTFESQHRTKGGKIFPVEITANYLEFGGKKYSCAFARDITDRVQAEESLQRAKAAAEAANRAKSDFLANMSHELRTPLNAILGFSQLMARDPGLNTEQQENLETIGRSGEHLLALINDVLELSKIEAGRVTLQEKSFDLHRLLDGLEEMFRLRAADKGLALIFDRAPNVPQYVHADEGKLRQVLTNLLGNAVKFTREGGITLRVGSRDSTPSSTPAPLLPTSYSLLHFEVEDTGPGIGPEETEAVFDAFVQTESGQAAKEGTGLGLPISRHFVKMMGGELTVSSELGTGSLFKFDVQIEMADAADVPTSQPTRRVIGLAPSQRAADGGPYRLLIAEDREASRKLLIKLLEPLGFEVREAVNGQEAVEIWELWEPHLIWMDMRMPVMDGHQATKHIKATAKGQATVVIALTASAFEEDRQVILSEGCDDFVRKPFREAEIFDKLAIHLGVRFVYEESETTTQAPGAADSAASPHERLTSADLADLPSDWVTKLYQAAVQADGDMVLDLIEQIRTHHPSVADALTSLARNYRLDIIVTLTQQWEDKYV